MCESVVRRKYGLGNAIMHNAELSILLTMTHATHYSVTVTHNSMEYIRLWIPIPQKQYRAVCLISCMMIVVMYREYVIQNSDGIRT